jgi:anaphase-promoting complex subunit 6
MLFLGMEHAKLKNWRLAEEFLTMAEKCCNNDPLLLNELGVIHFEKQE